MRKNIYWLAMMLLPLMGLMSSCSEQEEIVFDHEQPAFKIESNKILLETILPSNTVAEEDVYIVGAFNGMTDETVIGNDAWKVSLRDEKTGKRGIYLDPTKFVG